MYSLFAPTALDFYKTGHIFQYPQGTTEVYSNWTPRSDRLAPVIRESLDGLPAFDGKVVWFGLQAFMQAFLIDSWKQSFFDQARDVAVRRYKRRMDTALGDGAVPVTHIEALHALGYLPVEIRALPEGSLIPMRVPALTIVNTLPEFFWVTNYLETAMSAELWKASTVATIAREFRRLFEHYAALTGTPAEFVPWQGHDFSMRGIDGIERAMVSGAAHLLSFTGTDTVSAIDFLEEYYDADAEAELIGGSVPATEHSVMCMGLEASEPDTIRRLITEVYPAGIVSIVSDTWNFWKVITECAEALRPEILARRPDALGNAKVVFRPDSGDPVLILSGLTTTVIDTAEEVDQVSTETVCLAGRYFVVERKDGKALLGAEVSAAEVKGAVECLWDLFGGSLTATGHRLLNPRVGLIYGDSITLERGQRILARLAAKGFASGNVVFGIGSYTYQYLTRDCFGWAMKATAGVVNGSVRELVKDPVTDNGTKRSARGYLRVVIDDGRYVLRDRQARQDSLKGELRPVFRDGRVLGRTTLAEIRARLQGAD